MIDLSVPDDVLYIADEDVDECVKNDRGELNEMFEKLDVNITHDVNQSINQTSIAPISPAKPGSYRVAQYRATEN